MSNAFDRVYGVLSGKLPDRVPFIPKIWVDLSSKLTNTPLIEVMENPYTALKVMVEAAISIGADGVRQYHFPERKLHIEGNSIFEIDKAGNRLGDIDIKGGLCTRLYNRDNYNPEEPYVMAHYHYWTTINPVIRDIDDVKRICVPEKSYYEEIGWGERQRKLMDIHKDQIAFIGDLDSATLAFYEALRGMNQAMYDLIDEPELVHRVMEKGVMIAIEKGKHHIDSGIRILRLNDSIANMSVISPYQWREFIKPHMKDVCDELHRYDPEVRIYCHICGNILPVIDDLLETGLDCIAPLDPLGGFTPAQIRNRVGNFPLMGGINTLSFINSSEEEIIEEAKACMKQAGLYGDFILGSGCVVPRNTEKKMLSAVSKTVKEFGSYREGRLYKL